MGKVLVAYFSASGTTACAARSVADAVGGELYEIVPREPYTAEDLDWRNKRSRSSREMNDPACRPELSAPAPDVSGHDAVLLGYPIWWGGAACPARTFAAGNDLTGKTVVPFCTSGSSPIGSSGERLAEIAGTGMWQDGERFSAGATDEAVAWASALGL